MNQGRLRRFNLLLGIAGVLLCSVAIAEEGHPTSPAAGASSGAFSFSDITSVIDPASRAGCMAGESYWESWTEKGVSANRERDVSRMPIRYFNGMMLSFAKNVCDAKASTGNVADNFIGVLKRPPSGTAYNDEGMDTLAHYGENSVLASAGGSDDVRNIMQTYSLLLPLGMIETSGDPTKGRNEAVNNEGVEAEAGLFQVSYNSTGLGDGSMKAVYQELLAKYKSERRCMSEVFGDQSGGSLSETGDAVADFRNNMRSCPALAIDYMAALSRKSHKHNGPFKRKYAQPRSSCMNALSQVAELAQKDERLCGNIGSIAPSSADIKNFEDYLAANPDAFRSIRHGNSYNNDTGNGSYINPYGYSQPYNIPPEKRDDFKNDYQSEGQADGWNPASMLGQMGQGNGDKEKSKDKGSDVPPPSNMPSNSGGGSGDFGEGAAETSPEAVQEADSIVNAIMERITKPVPRRDEEGQVQQVAPVAKEAPKQTGGRGQVQVTQEKQ